MSRIGGGHRRLLLIAGIPALLVLLHGSQATGQAHPAPDAMGPMSTVSLPAFTGTFDKHTVLYVYTDTTNKAQAHADHVAYSPTLAKAFAIAAPVYFVTNGAHAHGAIFTNEPGEAGYSPLVQVVEVRWNMSAAAVVLESDEQIRKLARQGVLTLTRTGTVISAPIVKVEGGENGTESGSE